MADFETVHDALDHTGLTGVGGGGSAVTFATTRRTAGDYSLNTTGWQNLDTGLDITIAAASGDTVICGISSYAQAQNNTLAWDIVTVVGGSPVSSFAAGGAVAGQPSAGLLSWYCPTSSGATAMNRTLGGETPPLTLGAGDVSGGNVVLRIRVSPSNTTARTVSASAAGPFVFWAKVYSA